MASAPSIKRGTRLRSALPGYGVVGQNVVYVVALTPRHTKLYWRVYRLYSEFKEIKRQLSSQGLGTAPLPPENNIGVATVESIESRLMNWHG